MKLPKFHFRSWVQRLQLRGMVIGAATISLLWGASLYHRLDNRIKPAGFVENTTLKPMPSIDQMNAQRSAFRRDQIYPPPSADQMVIITNQLIKLNLTPDQGTLELLTLMAEHNNKSLLEVVYDLKQIAIGHYAVAENYNIHLERRLEGRLTRTSTGKLTKVASLHYEVIENWIPQPALKTWKIGKKIFGLTHNKPSERRLPDNPYLVLESFLDIVPEAIKAGRPPATAN